MRFTANFQLSRVNFSAYRQEMHRALTEAISYAAAMWLGATVVPVWSGASRATFFALASRIKYQLNIAPVVSSRIPLGIANSFSELVLSPDAGQYTFTYATWLPHLVYNEYNNANLLRDPATGRQYFYLKNPGPYHFQQKGQAAFTRVARSVRLPNPYDSLSRPTITV